MNQLIDELKGMFKQGDLLTKLIFINTAVFVVTALVDMGFFLFNTGYNTNIVLELPAGLTNIMVKPWTFITYMFYHQSFIHFIFNVLMLYWMGRIFLMFYQQRDLVNLYLFGGLIGGLTFIIAYNIFPALTGNAGFAVLVGASAAIMAIMVAAAVTQPEMPVKLALLGEIKLKWLVLIVFGMRVPTEYASNPGGCFSHIGGAVAGFFFATSMSKGTNIAAWIGSLLDFFVNLKDKVVNMGQKKPKFKVVYNSQDSRSANSDEAYNMRKKNEKDEIDAILDKIKTNGYDGLTAEEKAKLFNASKK